MFDFGDKDCILAELDRKSCSLELTSRRVLPLDQHTLLRSYRNAEKFVRSVCYLDIVIIRQTAGNSYSSRLRIRYIPVSNHVLHITALNAKLGEIEHFARAVRGSLRDNSILGKVFEWCLLAKLRQGIEHREGMCLQKILQFQGFLPAEAGTARLGCLETELKKEVLISKAGDIPVDIEAGTLLVPASPSFPTFDFAVVTKAATDANAAEVFIVMPSGFFQPLPFPYLIAPYVCFRL